jgi:VWA domain-containing protein
MTLTRSVALLVTVLALCDVPPAQAQQTFQFAVSASDASGAPVTDLKPEDVVMTENGTRQQVVKVEPLSVPIKLTIVVDNGVDSTDALQHYRSGLTGLVEALPPDIEVTLISIAPQPRTVLRPTTDHVQILRAINGFAPEQAAPRFSDALVEFSQRLQKEARDRRIAPYVPVMIMLSTTSVQQSSYEAPEITKAVNFLVTRRARLNMIVMSTRTGQATSAQTLNASVQATIGIPVVKATNGRYEALALSSRLTTLLPEWGKDLAVLHQRQTNQVRVTVERKQGGELQTPRIELARTGLNGQVTIDGFLP